MVESGKKFTYDLGVIGLGRVGLPLALSFAEKGLRVIGFERSEKQLEALREGRMPFAEPGYDQLVASHAIELATDQSSIVDVEHLIITVGTPLRHHVETDLSQVIHVLESIRPFLREGQTLILRSTVAPQTTRSVKRWLERHTSFTLGLNFFLAFCPERLAGGKAKFELETLPQVVGAQDAESSRRASQLFSRLSPKIFTTDFVSAELLKLFTNIYRYVNFAVANQFALIADQYGANVYEIVRMTNDQYPRQPIPFPGLTAGACLRKDFGMICEDNPYTDLFLSAWRVNEHTPRFLILQLMKRTAIHNKTVFVLGATFKRDSDDARDSLTPKLIRYLEREVPKKIFLNDPHMGSVISDEREDFSMINTPLGETLAQADIVFIAMNHSVYEKEFRTIYDQAAVGTWFVDLWNVSRRDTIFFRK